MLNDAQRRFLDHRRVAHLATADRHGVPHLVPVCFHVRDASVYITVDEKPKRPDIPLKRLRNIRENPAVALTADRWHEDWTCLAWVMLRGVADILVDGEEHDRAQNDLRQRYPQYRSWTLRPCRSSRSASNVFYPGDAFSLSWIRSLCSPSARHPRPAPAP